MSPLFGQITADGVCLAIAVWVLVGQRGKGKLADVHETSHIAWWMMAFGLFAQTAGQAFHAPQQVGDALTAALDAQIHPGAAGLTVLLVIVLFGMKPRPIKDVVVGATLPASAMASGSILALPFTIAGGFIHGLVGA